MVNVLIVDAQEVDRDKLERILRIAKDYVKVYHAESKEEAMEISLQNDIHMFFIDIHIKDSCGFDFALELRKIPRYKLAWIVFLTNNIDYMLKAFKEIHCYDYILKPFTKDKIKELIEIVTNYLVLKEQKERENNKSIVLERGTTVYKIFVDDIIFIEVNQRTCIVYTRKETYTLNRISLKKIMEIVDVEYIVKTYKSFAVNAKYIKKIEKISRSCFEISFYNCSERALLSSNYSHELKEVLE